MHRPPARPCLSCTSVCRVSALLQTISWAAWALGNLAAKCGGKCNFVPPDGLQALLTVLDHDHVEAQKWAARALGHVARSGPTLPPAIAKAGGAAALIRSLQRGEAEVQKWAAWALGLLLSEERDCPETVCPAAGPLRDALAQPDAEVQEHAAAALGLMAVSGPGRAALCSAELNVVAALVTLVGNASTAEAARVRAAAALATIARASPEHAAVVAAAGAVGPVVGLLLGSQQWGTCRVATALLAALAAAPGQCRSLVASGALPALVQQLPAGRAAARRAGRGGRPEPPRGDRERDRTRDLAVSALWAVVRADATAHAAGVVEACAVPPLVCVLTRSGPHAAPEGTRAQAAQLLALLMYRADGAAAAQEAGLVSALVRSTCGAEGTVWPHAALAMGLAAVGPAEAEQVVSVGAAEALQAVLQGTEGGVEAPEGPHEAVRWGMAAKGLHHCAGVPALRPRLVAQGVVPVLAAVLRRICADPTPGLGSLVSPASPPPPPPPFPSPMRHDSDTRPGPVPFAPSPSHTHPDSSLDRASAAPSAGGPPPLELVPAPTGGSSPSPSSTTAPPAHRRSNALSNPLTTTAHPPATPATPTAPAPEPVADVTPGHDPVPNSGLYPGPEATSGPDGAPSSAPNADPNRQGIALDFPLSPRPPHGRDPPSSASPAPPAPERTAHSSTTALGPAPIAGPAPLPASVAATEPATAQSTHALRKYVALALTSLTQDDHPGAAEARTQLQIAGLSRDAVRAEAVDTLVAEGLVRCWPDTHEAAAAELRRGTVPGALSAAQGLLRVAGEPGAWAELAAVGLGGDAVVGGAVRLVLGTGFGRFWGAFERDLQGCGVEVGDLDWEETDFMALLKERKWDPTDPPTETDLAQFEGVMHRVKAMLQQHVAQQPLPPT